MMNTSVLAELRRIFGPRELPAVGTVYEDIYTVVLCPVCGSKTLDNHDICLECGWEYDGRKGDCWSSCNRTTARYYREDYLEAIRTGQINPDG